MDHRVLLKVLRTSKDTDEEIFRCNMEVESRRDNQTDESNTVGNFLDSRSGASQGWRGDPNTAPVSCQIGISSTFQVILPSVHNQRQG